MRTEAEVADWEGGATAAGRGTGKERWDSSMLDKGS